MLAALSERTRMALLGGVGALLAFFVFGGARTGSGPRDPLDAVPHDSFLVATVNVAELRRSPIYDVLFGKDGVGNDAREPHTPSMLDARALGIAKLADACGFDPLGRVERLAVGVPEEGDKGELGVAARVDVTREELSRCAESLAGQRGGKVDTHDVGSFVVVEDQAAMREPARPRLAYGRGGLLVVGRGAWFDAMLAAADGKKLDARSADAHAAIRAALTRAEGWQSPTLLVSALLPKSLRDRLRGDMEAEVAAIAAGAGERPQSVMAGVLGVSTVGLALRAGASGGSIDAAVELACDTPEACGAVEKLLQKKRFEWSKELMLRMVGLGPLLDSIDVKRDGAHVRVTASAPANALATTLDRIVRFSAGGRERGAIRPAPPAAKAAGSSVKSETIPAPRPSR